MPEDVIILSPASTFAFENHWYYEIAQPSHFWIDGRFNMLMRMIDRVGIDRRQPLKGMEFGCGNGVLRAQLEGATDWTIDASDLDIEGLRLAQPARGKTYRYDVFDRNPDFKGRYDVLFLFDVIEHIADTKAFLSACMFHLRPGGYVFINVPAMPSLYSAYDRVQGHERRYNLQSLRRALEEAALAPLDIRYWGQCLVPFVFVRKLLAGQSKTPEEIIRLGFQPPSQAANGVFRFMLKGEGAMVPKPLRGTSLIAAARRT